MECAQTIQDHPGGSDWLMSLRQTPYDECLTQLCELPGIGPKVAACICLFSLDKPEAIPVDTHVWAIAQRWYGIPKGVSLTPKRHKEVQEIFEKLYGDRCGWAHNTLFWSKREEPRSPGTRATKAKGEARGGKRRQDGGEEKVEAWEGQAAEEAPTKRLGGVKGGTKKVKLEETGIGAVEEEDL